MNALRDNGITFHLGVNFNEIKEENGKKTIVTYELTYLGIKIRKGIMKSNRKI